MMDRYDEIRTRVLTDNTAQGVLNHLKTLESNRSHVRTRWIWELLQNARDASTSSSTGLVATIEQNEGEIVFRHNGANFKIDEIAHLIYHGSTKTESAETIGQYGSGFLTTHLLSPEINVSGQLDDGRHFEFQLKREVGSVGELSDSMDRAWRDFISALSEATPTTDNFTTKFRYPFGGDHALEAVKEGIAILKLCAPLVVAFNREYSDIEIRVLSETQAFKVVERAQLEQDGLQQVTVAEIENGNRREKKYLLAQGGKASVAVPMESNDSDSICLPIGGTPRLFLGFPLVGTENFSFPAVINSLNFTPTENRDGVWLGQNDDDEANQENQAVINEACNLLVHLIQFAASSGWHNTHLLAEVPEIREQSWLNSKWLRECLKEQLIEKIRQTSAVLNESGEGIPPRESKLPFAETTEGVECLWDLLVEWKEDCDIWPKRNEAAGWCNVVKSWAMVYDVETSHFDEVMNGRKLASFVDRVSHDPNANPRTHRLSLLNSHLRKGVSGIEWLDRLIRFLKDYGLSEVVHQYHIVPSQGGFLRALPNLHRDQGIHEELKDIAELLEWRIRLELRDTRVASLSDEAGNGDWDNKYVIAELIKKLQERAEKNPDANFAKSSVGAFAWIVSQKDWDLLRGFPAFAEEDVDADNRRVIKLERDLDKDVVPLTPVKSWTEDLQPYYELFPQRHILANSFFEAAPGPDIWQTLDQEGFLRKDVVITKDVYFREFLLGGPMSDEEHETTNCVTVTDIAFISRDDVGIMARVRQSQRLARIFWRFLTEWVTEHDYKGLEISEALCGCKENHRYYPAEWLGPLKRNRWVPMGGDRRAPATAQSLGSLLRGSGWDPGSLSENYNAVKLLEAIGVTRFDLMRELFAEDHATRVEVDNAFTNMLAATSGNIIHLNHAIEFIEDLKGDSNLPDFLKDRRERRRIVRENQHLGSQVEQLVKESLEGEGFTVWRTGVGSDFKIEYNPDDLVSLELARAGQRWLVEVKATRDQRVRMTEIQAKTAVDEEASFLLCVVPLESGDTTASLDDVKASMRFIKNIGPRVAPLCDDLDGFKELRDDITSDELSGVQLEVESGAVRVRVDSSVWQDDGFPLADLTNRLE